MQFKPFSPPALMHPGPLRPERRIGAPAPIPTRLRTRYTQHTEHSSRTPSPRAVALVTGASSGIGCACAEALARGGFIVFGTSRHSVPPCADEPFRMFSLDVRDDMSVAHCVKSVLSETGRIDVLVNNAGVALVGAIEETTIDEFRNVLDTNLFGAVRMIKAVLPVMRRQGRGRIVNIGSMMAFLPMPYSAAYCASKHAIHGLSESIDHEVRNFGIRVVVVEPGFIRTDIVQHSPVAFPIQAYAGARDFPVQNFRRQVERGRDSVVVARVVVEAATAEHPRSRYLPDAVARLMRVVRTILPYGAFDFAFRRYFRLD